MRLVVLVNTLQSVNSAVYTNHCQFWAAMGRTFPDRMKDQLLFLTPHRMSIDAARNFAAKVALEQEADYLMFIDDDVLIEPNTFEVLKNADKDIIMALTYIRGYPFKPMLFKADPRNEQALTTYDDFEDHIDENGLVDCEAIGFSCALIKTRLLKEMRPPYFVTGTNNTEDIYFCIRAKRELGASIFTHTKVPTGHMLSPEAIMRMNRDELLAYHEKYNVKEEQDRGFGYVKACLANIK